MRFSPGVTEVLILLFFAIPIFVAIWMFWLCWTRGRDPEQGSISVQYDPPDHLTPGECAALVENKIAMNTITATIVDLSVKGYLAIKQGADSSQAAVASGGKSFVFHLLKEQSDWNTLKPHEQAVLTGMFSRMNPLEILTESMSKLQNAAPDSPAAPAYGRVRDRIATAEAIIAENPGMREVTDRQFGPRNEVALLELHNQFYMHLPRIRDAVFDSIVASGCYDKRPDRVRLAYGAAGVAIGLVLGAAGVVLAAATKTPPWAWMLAGVLTGLIILVAGRMMTPRTDAGTQTLAKVMGFRDFIGRVDKDQIERVEKSPDLFEKYLPYAMALRVETKWSQAFGNLSMPAPRWYGSNRVGDFYPAHLVDDLKGMSSQAESVLTTKPASAR